MKELLDMAKDGFEALTKMPSVLLLWLAMNVVGLLLEKSSALKKFVAVILVGTPAILMVFIMPYDPVELSHKLMYPNLEFVIRCIAIGVIIGFVALGTHKTLLPRISKFIPGFSTGDTTVTEKPKEP